MTGPIKIDFSMVGFQIEGTVGKELERVGIGQILATRFSGRGQHAYRHIDIGSS